MLKDFLGLDGSLRIESSGHGSPPRLGEESLSGEGKVAAGADGSTEIFGRRMLNAFLIPGNWVGCCEGQ